MSTNQGGIIRIGGRQSSDGLLDLFDQHVTIEAFVDYMSLIPTERMNATRRRLASYASRYERLDVCESFELGQEFIGRATPITPEFIDWYHSASVPVNVYNILRALISDEEKAVDHLEYIRSKELELVPWDGRRYCYGDEYEQCILLSNKYTLPLTERATVEMNEYQQHPRQSVRRTRHLPSWN